VRGVGPLIAKDGSDVASIGDIRGSGDIHRSAAEECVRHGRIVQLDIDRGGRRVGRHVSISGVVSSPGLRVFGYKQNVHAGVTCGAANGFDARCHASGISSKRMKPGDGVLPGLVEILSDSPPAFFVQGWFIPLRPFVVLASDVVLRERRVVRHLAVQPPCDIVTGENEFSTGPTPSTLAAAEYPQKPSTTALSVP